MDEALHKAALEIRAAMPCSVELPAGTGKTHLVAALAATSAEQGERTLILTHTNAGVDVLRRRLRQFDVAPSAVRVETIASWCFDVVRHYPVLSGLTVGAEPDWAQSQRYYAGAAEAVQATAIRKVVQASYDFVIVDEYQDCVIEQHSMVLALHEWLPVGVFGDPLQSIFTFGNNVTVKWAKDVAATWPALALPVQPWRWRGHNEALGQWLIDIRSDLYGGRPIDLHTAPLRWCRNDKPLAAVNACFSQPRGDGSVAAIARFAPECADVASRTNGSYRMMEELEGSFMLKFAAIVDSGDPRQVAVATLQFAKGCISGVAAKLNTAVKDKLAKGQSVAHLCRPGAEIPLSLLSGLLFDSSPARVRETLVAIERLPDGRLYRREAWWDVLKALMIVAAGSELTVAQAVGTIRNRARIVGRAQDDRIISRPLLVKGLEYDHAVVLNAERYLATELYVALSRSRKSLTVVGNQRYLRPAPPQLS
jgi:AAA domain